MAAQPRRHPPHRTQGARACWPIADEAADRQVNDDGPPGDGGIGEVPLVTAVDTMRGRATAGAVHHEGVPSTRGDVHRAALDKHTLHQHRLQVRKRCIQKLVTLR